MEDIRIYDFEFNLLHVEPNIISSNWSLYYNAVGTWEGHFNIRSDIVSRVADMPYLVVTQGSKQAIVTGKQVSHELVLYGKTINWLLTRRTMPKFNTYNLPIAKDVESIARYVVGQSFPELTLGEVMGFENEKEFWRNTTNVTSDVIIDCLNNDGAGHEIVFNRFNGTWVFNVLKGKNLDLIVSEANKNAYETDYTENMLNYYTGGWYEQQAEEAEEGEEPGEPEWTYIAGDSTKTGIYKWDGVLSGSVESEAKSDLAKKKREQEIAAKAKGLVYGVDYSLGDIVKVQKQAGAWETAFEKRVKGVNLWYEHNNEGEQPIFEEG